jgi:quinol-cytochrome oxidoreductase complex cytochrome b subunit
MPSSQKTIKHVSFGILIATPIVYVLFNGFLSLILFTGLILLAVILLRKFSEQNTDEPVIDEEITKINNLEWYVRARENHYKNDLK